MKNSIALFFLRTIFALAIIVLIQSCSKTVYPSNWQETPVAANGELSEWSIPLPYYDESTKLNYAISNDNRNLYVCIRANSEDTQIKMLRAGFSLWIDTTGKKKQTIGITYPLPQRMLMNRSSYSDSQREQKTESSANKQKIISEQKQVLLTGFRNTDNGLSLIGKKGGVSAGLNYDSSGVLAYEIIIPFATFRDVAFSNSDTLKTWSIGLVLNGIESNAGKGNHEGGGGGMSMGGGMRGGGGRGGRGGGGRGGRGGNGSQTDNSSLSESKEVWNYIQLSSK